MAATVAQNNIYWPTVLDSNISITQSQVLMSSSKCTNATVTKRKKKGKNNNNHYATSFTCTSTNFTRWLQIWKPFSSNTSRFFLLMIFQVLEKSDDCTETAMKKSGWCFRWSWNPWWAQNWSQLNQQLGKHSCRLPRIFLAITEQRILLSLWTTWTISWRVPECHLKCTFDIFIQTFFLHQIWAESAMSPAKDFIKI